MADPFEVRMRFTSQLQHLNASTSSAAKAANYALRYAEFSDDLHSCIVEQLERNSNSMNNRANIMYFLPVLCETAKAQGETGYIRMIERDILRIIDLVAPDDNGGAANVTAVRKVLKQLQQKSFLKPQTVSELEECIAGRESSHAAPSSPGFHKPAGPSGSGSTGEAMMLMTAAGAAGGGGGGAAAITPAMRSTPHSTSHDATIHQHNLNPGIRLDKRQIEQRIEEDRERHKRARENIWAIPQTSTDLAHDTEFDKMWNETAPWGEDEDDRQKAKEEQMERAKHLGSEDV